MRVRDAKRELKLGFLENMNSRVRPLITDTDLYYIGKLKYKLEMFFKFFFHFERKPMGTIIK